MRFTASSTWPALPHHVFRPHRISHPPAAAAAALLRRPATFSRALHATPSSGNSGSSGGAEGNFLLVPGATMATILMLGILHARRLYNDKKSLQLRRRLRIVAPFLRILPLRAISRFWGFLMTMSAKHGPGHFIQHKERCLLLLCCIPKARSSFPSELACCAHIRNSYVENGRVVLKGQRGEGFITLSAIGATNVGSIQVAAFKMRSTVVLVFQAPVSESLGDGLSSDFRFCVKSGDKVKLREAIGR